MISEELRLTSWHRYPDRTLFEAWPQLQSIWRAELAAIAAYHTRQWETDADESGDILLAYVGDTLIGITGWYRLDMSEAGLRWHGVMPSFRKRGYSRRMIDLVCKHLPPEIDWVYEITRNPESRDAFCLCGFQVVTDAEVIERVVEDSDYGLGEVGWVLRRRNISIGA